MSVSVDIHLPGGRALFTSPGVLPARLVQSHGTVWTARLIHRIRRDRAAQAELRRDWRGLDLPLDARRASDPQLIAMLEQALARRRLEAHWLPLALTREMVPAQAPRRPAQPADVRHWNAAEKVLAAFSRAIDSPLIGRELKAQLAALIEPENAVWAIPVIVGLAFPATQPLMLGLAYAVAGMAGLRAVYEMIVITIDVIGATTEREIDAAADGYARALGKVGAAIIGALITRGVSRGVSTARGVVAARRAAPTPAKGAAPAPPPRKVPPNLRSVSYDRSQVQHAFKHADDFGVSGNANGTTLNAFQSRIDAHVRSPGTLEIPGSYRGLPVTHYYNPASGLNVIAKDGAFLSGWKLSPVQVRHVTSTGNLGGGR